MSNHKTWVGKILASVGHFFSGGLKAVAASAVAITEQFKTVLSGGFVKSIAEFVDATFKTHVADDIISAINAAIPHVLSVELAVEGLPDNATEQDVADFENRVFKAITGLSPTDKSKLYTTLAAQIYGIIKPQVDAHTNLTFAEIVKDVEQAYQDYLKDIADQNNSAQ